MNRHLKEYAAGGNPAAHQKTSMNINSLKSNKTQPEEAAFTVRLTIFCDDGTIITERVITGKIARSLHHIHQTAGGLTRSDALAKYGILSLSHHVFVLRHNYGLNILTERVGSHGRDGATWFGRYQMLDNIMVEVLSFGSAV